MGHLCDMPEPPVGHERNLLQIYITSLTEMLSGLLNAGFLRIQPDVVTTNACRKFQIDAITDWLACTHKGTWRQYWASTGSKEARRVSAVQSGASILLRGTLWPEQPPFGVLHRSPAIEGTGNTRLVSALDPVFDPDNKA